ncbi:hypothetical protein FSY59_09805 [Comamonas sp. Z3]|uniref:hypothetical protein n=1 Tax=Comamonas sp. Z3 TaxID=2601247 RepID=UPI0011E7442F|nr:hypothetical protein [Comamonas sp. Z3]TYK71443.1 hypothetical protein FSY59_09805 [Comamonas sp. Z3]
MSSGAKHGLAQVIQGRIPLFRAIPETVFRCSQVRGKVVFCPAAAPSSRLSNLLRRTPRICNFSNSCLALRAASSLSWLPTRKVLPEATPPGLCTSDHHDWWATAGVPGFRSTDGWLQFPRACASAPGSAPCRGEKFFENNDLWIIEFF